jgi:hypothetical protein
LESSDEELFDWLDDKSTSEVHGVRKDRVIYVLHDGPWLSKVFPAGLDGTRVERFFRQLD